MIEFILWALQNIALAPYNLFLAVTNPGSWLNWADPQSVMRFIYYGASVELFFVAITTFILITALGMFWSREILWRGVCASLKVSPTRSGVLPLGLRY